MQVRFLSGTFLFEKKQRRKAGFVLNKKDKIKEIWHSFKEWCKDIAGLIKEHKTVAIAILVFIGLVILAVAVSMVIGKGTKASEAAVIAESEASTEEVLTVPDEPLEENAYAEVNALVKEYYQAMADGDVAKVATLMTGLDDKEQIKIAKKSEYVESYPTITCYTKVGPQEDSYIVYAYYEVKLVDYETLTPGLNALYVCKNEDGNYYINGETQSDEVINYCEILSAQDDVVDLINTVQVRYNETKAENEELSKFLDELPDLLTAAVGEELAKLEAAETAATVEAETETETASETETVETTTETKIEKRAKTTDVVNVRSSDSQEADKVGKAQKGDEFIVLEEKANGWSKIEYEGEEAFIKTEFLEVIEEKEVEVEAADEEIDEEAAENSPSSGTATVKETINVRAKASTSADKLGVCYEGDKLEVVTKQADGWTKVKYKKKTGYVKSEFLE